MNQERQYVKITLYGLVQGIGFRPYVVRLANNWGIEGEVCNCGGAVRILAAAPFPVLEGFVRDFSENPAPLSEVIHMKKESLSREQYEALVSKSALTTRLSEASSHPSKCASAHDPLVHLSDHTEDDVAHGYREPEAEKATAFSIVESEASEGLVMLPPDLPVCEACLNEMHDPQNRRYKHHLISCTLCGPRYSIIKKAPYDRQHTAMASFAFCPECHKEYTSSGNRRFHAQTVSCHHCGPQLVYYDYAACYDDTVSVADKSSLESIAGRPISHGAGRVKERPVMLPPMAGAHQGRALTPNYTGEEAFETAVSSIREGLVVAVKGIGGYHYIVDPYHDEAVQSLRTLKEREQKPFAVCFKDVEGIKAYAHVTRAEEELLTSKARPIVLLEKKQDTGVKPFSPFVVQNSRFIGAFVAYTPLLVSLCEALGPLAATSANLTDAPIINEDSVMLNVDHPLLSGVLTHDREIMVSQDDSVAWVVHGKPQVIRRARGYTPLPLYVTPLEYDESVSVLAMGGELKSAFCLQKGPFAYVSQYLGDLGSLEAQSIYQQNLSHMVKLTGIKPQTVACDLHPDYASTRMAQGLGLPVIKVQHHHAHIASVMAEKGLRGPVLGVSFDGTGYGSDGTIWGGEFLLCQEGEFERVAHLRPIPMLMGDESMRDCQKAATAYLHAFGLYDSIEDDRYPVIRGALNHRVNTIESSSMGRLFDAVSSMLGLCKRSRYEAEGAILLENAAARAIEQNYSPYALSFGIIEQNNTLILDSEPLVKTLIKGRAEGILIEELALGFHLAVCEGIDNMLSRLRDRTKVDVVAFSGGVFQNKLVTEKTVEALEQKQFTVHLPALVPANDAGISLGQAFVAIHKLKRRG